MKIMIENWVANTARLRNAVLKSWYMVVLDKFNYLLFYYIIIIIIIIDVETPFRFSK